MTLASNIDLSDQLGDQMRGPSRTVWLCVATVVVFLVWAGFAWIDEIVRADGEIISSSRPQIVQNLEGGILASLDVSEGDAVAKGDVIASLHAAQFQATVDDLQEQVSALQIRKLRIEAELDGAETFDVPADLLSQNPDIVASELALLQARQIDFNSRSEGALRILEQVSGELRLMENMLAKEVVALIEVTRVRKAHADAQTRYDEVTTGSNLERAEAYSKTLQDLATQQQALKVAQDQLNRRLVRAPMDGVVNKIFVTTIGGVLAPGAEMFQITPMDETLLLETRVMPKDIANIRPGQDATVKLTAYDYTIYGVLKGVVDVVSADTFEAKRQTMPGQEPHYKVTIRMDKGALSDRQKKIEVRPGMQAFVELHTGQKTVLQYLMRPLYKSREAFREP